VGLMTPVYLQDSDRVQVNIHSLSVPLGRVIRVTLFLC